VLALPAISVAKLPRREMVGQHLYFLRAANGLVKIGQSGDLRSRLTGLRVGSPIPLEVVGFARVNSKTYEKVAHALLDGTRSHGEWFHPSEIFLRLLRVTRGQGWERLQSRRGWIYGREVPGAVTELRALITRSTAAAARGAA
jgi:hypothetical protein